MSSPYVEQCLSHRKTPDAFRFMAATAFVVYSVEVAIMFALDWDQLSNRNVLVALLDATLLTVTVSPILYYWLVTPFIEKARLAEQILAEALRSKEAQAEELAAALARQNLQKLALDEHTIVSETDLRGRIIYANSEFIRISGYTEAELIGKNHRIINSGAHPPQFWEEMYATIAGGGVWKAEVCNRSKDGSLYWVQATNAAVKDSAGKITGYVSVHSDITKTMMREQSLKSAHAQLIIVTEKAKAASLAKSNFLSTMSHEMRTPLNGVLGALELLGKTGLSKDQIELVDIAHQSGEALLVHINDVLDISKLEAGKLELDKKPFDLNRIVKSVLDIAAPQADVRGNRLESEFRGELPRYVIGDRVRVRQVLLNLVSNASKFTNNGRVTVRVERVGGTDEQPQIEVGVFDTGFGIAQNRLKDLFQEFSMIDSSYTRKTSGTGLGLAISKRLIEAMGGTVGVDSVEGEGSHFWFRVALAGLHEVPPEEAPVMRTAAALARKLRILLADDNVTNQIVASRMLALSGHEVVCVGNGKEAVEAARGERFDAIFMDISMPEMDGMEATRKIRELEEPFRSVPIIALTANAIAGDRERFLAAGMDEYLTKPIRRVDLEARLAEIVPRETDPTSTKADEAIVVHSPYCETGGEALGPLLDAAELDKLAAETAPEIVPLIVGEFLREMKRRLEEALAALSTNSLEDLKKVTHAIAGASASVGALRLRQIAKRVELDCIAGGEEQARVLARELPHVMELTDTAFREHLAMVSRALDVTDNVVAA